MTDARALPPAGAPSRHLLVSVESLRRATLWLMIFGGSVVMIKPSPYEVFGIVAMITWATGLKFSREMIPIASLMLLYMTGALITLVPVLHLPDTQMWTAIGWFMAFTAIFFMMLVSEHSLERMDVIIHAYIATAVVCSAIGIAAYFRLLPSADSFLLYSRVKSTFEDPNVFGPFLVFPIVVLTQRLYLNGLAGSIRTVVALLIILAALFLSFSRGAWGHLLASLALMTIMTLWCARNAPTLRKRVIILCVAGLVVVVALLAVLLSFDAVSKLFAERASLEQNYDLGQFGRFNRHWLGFVLALDHPAGIGMLQFGHRFGEDTHNSYLNAFMSYGWLGGVIWPAIVISSCVVAWTWCLKPSPWRHQFICVVATFQVVVAEAWVIDIDHWRHVWLLFGLNWGLAVATARHGRARRITPGPAPQSL